MGAENFRAGMIVYHPTQRQWGPGRILQVAGSRVTVHFRDDPDGRDHRIISLDHVALELAAEQSDPILDNITAGLLDRASKAPRVSIEQGIEHFCTIFPLGFRDQAYIGNGKLGPNDYGERLYKLNACGRFAELLGGAVGPALLAAGDVDELVRRACQVAGTRLNLLSSYENMAFHDGLTADRQAARRYFEALFAIVAPGEIDELRFGALADAVANLPVAKGRARVATWPVLTLLPALADPQRFIFIKPEITKSCAERLRVDIQYSAELRWVTFHKVSQMAARLLRDLQPLGAADYIDVQSFMWVIAKYELAPRSVPDPA